MSPGGTYLSSPYMRVPTPPPPPSLTAHLPHSYTWQVNLRSTVATSECLNLCNTYPMKSIVIEKSKRKVNSNDLSHHAHKSINKAKRKGAETRF